MGKLVYGQSVTFNKRIQLGCTNTVLSGLEVTDSCYYATGFARDSTTCQPGTVFVRFDTLGNVELHKIYEDIESWHPFLRTTWDNKLVIAPYYLDNSNSWRGGIYKFEENGSGYIFKQYNNPYTLGAFIRPDDLQITSDSGFIISSSINDVQGVSDIGLLCLDKYGTEQWHITRGSPNYVDHTPCVYVDGGAFVVGFQQDNLSGVHMNYTVRSVLEAIDSIGNILWTYQSPDSVQVHRVNDFTKTKDNGWIVATGWGSERLSGNGSYAIPIKEAYIYKLDNNKNFLWGTKFHSDTLTTADFTRIVELEDSSLVVFGTVVRLYPQPNPTHHIMHGRIVKVSPHGDSIWSREYEYLTAASAKHSIYDAEHTSDGGFLICGESNGYSPNSSIYQQGWLLKLDEHGCLVPGCHIIPNSINPVEKKPIVEVRLYPNPTIDYLNLHYRNPILGEKLTFRVTDISGRILNSYTTADISDKTYIVPVSDLIKGIYVIEIIQDGEVVYGEQFVKG